MGNVLIEYGNDVVTIHKMIKNKTTMTTTVTPHTHVRIDIYLYIEIHTK